MSVSKLRINHFWYFETLAGERLFDNRDAELINNRLSLEELKAELHNADIQETVSRSFGNNKDENYWHHLRGLVEYLYYGRRWLRQLDSQEKRRHRHGKEPRLSIEEIKQGHDIVEVIERYVNLKRIGQRYKGLCPFHDDRHPSLSVTPETQRWKCFGCGRGGDIIDFIEEMGNLDTAGAIKQLAGVLA